MEQRKWERLLPTIEKELLFCSFFRNSGLACRRKALNGWRLTSRANCLSGRYEATCPLRLISHVTKGLGRSSEGGTSSRITEHLLLLSVCRTGHQICQGLAGFKFQPPSVRPKRERQAWCYSSPIPKENKEKGGKKAFSSPQRRSQVQFSRLGKENLRRVTFSLSDARWALLCLRLSANPSNSFCHHGSSALLKRTMQSLIMENNELDYTNCWSWK